MRTKINGAFLVLVTYLLILSAAPASAGDPFLHEFKHSCEATLGEWRLDKDKAAWAFSVECHWHPELGPNGMWWIHH